MEVSVRKYRNEDIDEMIRIWNEVVEEGVAFPQEEFLDGVSGKAFLRTRLSAVLRSVKRVIYLDCIFSTLTMWAGADTYAIPAMP